MNNTFTKREKEYVFTRYPKTQQRSLKPWNAADEHILDHFESLDFNKTNISIYNDRFGFLTCFLHTFSPNVVINFASQRKSIEQNLESNHLSKDEINFIEPFSELEKKINVAILKIPKSMDLFRLQLMHISKSLDGNGIVLCSFMTKYFTKQMLTIAEEFFENVEQSKAWKKSRVLVLKKDKPIEDTHIINSISFEDKIFKQYFGVFSAKHIDDASQFLVKNWKINEDAERVLDLASGNGFLGKMIRHEDPDREIHLLDDDWLAVESSRLNFARDDENTYFHFNDSLDIFDVEFFDMVVCNPPFHFEFETNIEVAIDLFKQVKRVLKKEGSFQIVANRHLNYKTHLVKLFDKVEKITANKKFEIYKCSFSSEN